MHRGLGRHRVGAPGTHDAARRASGRSGWSASTRECTRPAHTEGARPSSGGQPIVEPVFAQTKVTRRAGHFLRRGLSACRSEWRLMAATHNLLKLWRYGLTAVQPAG